MNKRIDQLTLASALTGTEIAPLVQSSGNVQATLNAIETYQNIPIAFNIIGKPTTGQVFNYVLSSTVILPANFAGTVTYAETPTTSNAVFTVKMISGGVLMTIGTVTITNASHTSCTLSVQAAMVLAQGDVLQLIAPTQDATLADIGITFLATLFNPTLDLNFLTGTLDPRITFTRAAGPATYFDSTGTMQTAGTNIPRFDFDPSTGRRNYIRNNTMVGAVAGTPGTAPTNWIGWGAVSGLTQTIVGTGVESGIPYIDVRYVGTTNNTGLTPAIETSTAIAATTGQTWTLSTYMRLVGGTLNNISWFALGWQEVNSVPSFLISHGSSAFFPSNAGLASQRYTYTTTNNQATCAYVFPYWGAGFSSGVAVDFTVRIGAPQMELGGVATAFIPTSSISLGADLLPRGLLVEEQRTNIIYPSVYSTGAWGVNNGTSTQNAAIAPDGTTTAGLIVADGTNNIHCFQIIPTTARVGNTTYTVSIFAKAGTSSKGALSMRSGGDWPVWCPQVNFDLSAVTAVAISGFASAVSIVAVGNGWFRVSATQTTIATPIGIAHWAAVQNAAGADTFVGAGESMYFWGAQLEIGSFPTSYIPSTVVNVTRYADVANMPIGTWLNSNAGTLAVQYILEGRNGMYAPPISFVGTNSGTDYISPEEFTGGTPTAPNLGAAGGVLAGGVGQAALSYTNPVIPAGVVHRGANAWQVGAPVNGAHDGVVMSPSVGNLVATPVLIALSFADRDVHYQPAPSLWVSRARYYPRPLSSTELQIATT